LTRHFQRLCALCLESKAEEIATKVSKHGNLRYVGVALATQVTVASTTNSQINIAFVWCLGRDDGVNWQIGGHLTDWMGRGFYTKNDM
jgi:hypothetical protein